MGRACCPLPIYVSRLHGTPLRGAHTTPTTSALRRTPTYRRSDVGIKLGMWFSNLPFSRTHTAPASTYSRHVAWFLAWFWTGIPCATTPLHTSLHHTCRHLPTFLLSVRWILNLRTSASPQFSL